MNILEELEDLMSLVTDDSNIILPFLTTYLPNDHLEDLIESIKDQLHPHIR